MKITFLYPSWTGEFGLFGHFARRNATWPPLNLALLAAIARQAGWEAEIIDAEALGLDKYHLAQRAVQSRADVIGMSAYSPFYHLSSDVAKAIKKLKPSQCIIGGGPHFTIMKEKAFTEEFDFAFIGEAEESLPMWLKRYKWRHVSTGVLWNDIPGLLYRTAVEILQSDCAPAWVDGETKKGSELGRYPLDRFPQPARDLLPMRRYKLGTKDGRRHFSSIQTMRGCPWTCLKAGTQVLMYDRSYKMIEHINNGDKVFSFDVHRMVPVEGTVKNSSSSMAEDVHRLRLSNGTSIDITGDHPVWARNAWKEVHELSKGEEIFTAAPVLIPSNHPALTGLAQSPWIHIEDIAFLGRSLVYSIEVSPHPNFFANWLLVHNCIFCASDALKTTRVVMRSPASVVREMQDTVKLYGVDHFYIVDDVLTLWPAHITEICDRIDEAGLKITFEGATRANMVTDALMERMAKSGLVRLCFGLETVDPEMRETMEKKVPLSAYVTANAICNRHGVEATNSCMIGLPGESRKTVEMLFSFLENARDVLQANFAVAVPYPGTKFYDWAAQGTHGVELLGKDFSEYLRYGHAVSKTDQATAQQLIEWQNEGFVRFYSRPFRWPAMFRKHGVFGFLLMMWRVAKLWRRRVARPFTVHPGVPA